MSQDPNLARTPDYHAARAEEERKLADLTQDANARAAHLAMAKKYADLAQAGAGAERAIEEPQQAG